MAIEKVKSMIQKVQKDMVYYYNQRRTPASMFSPRDRVFLNASDIKTIHPSTKLLHWKLEPFIVE